MGQAAPIPETLRLLREAGCLPYGLALVEFGSPETIAAMFKATRGVVDETQAALADPERRQPLVAEFERAAATYARAPDEACEYCCSAADGSVCHCPLALIREAERRPGGVQVLTSADLEAAAIQFGVHPFVVLGARDVLARRERERAEAEKGASPRD